jgi:hypothetical protein
MEFWQVQQIKMITHQLRENDQLTNDVQRLLYQQQTILKQAERANKRPAPAPAHNAEKPAEKPAAEGASPDVKVLLQTAQAGLQRAIEANDRKDLAASAAEVAAVKDAIWKAGDMWPKYKTPLQELMGPLDYAVKRLNRGDQADFSKPMKTVSALLRKGQ